MIVKNEEFELKVDGISWYPAYAIGNDRFCLQRFWLDTQEMFISAVWRDDGGGYSRASFRCLSSGKNSFNENKRIEKKEFTRIVECVERSGLLTCKGEFTSVTTAHLVDYYTLRLGNASTEFHVFGGKSESKIEQELLNLLLNQLKDAEE